MPDEPTSDDSKITLSDLDKDTLANGILDYAIYCRLAEAVCYDAASTVLWAERQLELFKQGLTEGKSIQVLDAKYNANVLDKNSPMITIFTIGEFDA